MPPYTLESMKHLLLSILLSHCFFISISQTSPNKNEVPSSLASFKRIVFKLSDSLRKKDKLNPSLFHGFTIIDERADTTRFGVHTELGMFNNVKNRQFVFSRLLRDEMSGHLNAYFANKRAAYSAVIVVRTLWLSDANYGKEDFVKANDPVELRKHVAKLKFKAEVYAEKDSIFTPLFRYDSVIYSQAKINNNYSQKLDYDEMVHQLADMIDDLADSASITLNANAGSRKKLQWKDIQQFNRSRFDAVINKDSTLVRGVYASFEEFKNNQPSISDFEIKDEKGRSILYIKDNGGESYYSHTAWGYCDGKTIYVMKDGILVPTWKEGNAWYLFGISEVTIQVGGGMTHAPGSTYGTPGSTYYEPGYSKNITQKHVYTVDMDNGKVY